MKTFVYRNLTNKIWSLKVKGRVVGRFSEVLLRDCEFRVSEKGRQYVLRTGKKTVHAGVVGIPSAVALNPENLVEIGYNPKNNSTFIRKDTGQPVTKAPFVLLDYPRVLALNPT